MNYKGFLKLSKELMEKIYSAKLVTQDKVNDEKM